MGPRTLIRWNFYAPSDIPVERSRMPFRKRRVALTTSGRRRLYSIFRANWGTEESAALRYQRLDFGGDAPY